MKHTIIEVAKSDGLKVKGLAWKIAKPIGNVVIATGMEEHSSRYDDFAQFLNANGYDVYCLDHFGQGLNAPTVADLGKFPKSGFRIMVELFDELIAKLRVSNLNTYIFGHSMGSFIVQDYIQRNGDAVEKAIICGSNGPDPMVKVGYQLARMLVSSKKYDKKSKFFNNLVFGGFSNQIPHDKTGFDWLSYNKENVMKYIADPYTGYGSTAGFYREFFKGLNRLYKPKFMAKIRQGLPILIISGQDDPVGHKGKGVKKLKKIYDEYGLKDVTLTIYPKMRHEILNEVDHQKVYDDILAFLKK